MLSFRTPLRFLRESYARLFLTLLALTSGVALVCAIDIVNRAVLRAFVEVIDDMAGRVSLQVIAGDGGLFPQDIAEKVGAVAGVETAVPVVNASAFTSDGSGDLLTIQGIDVGSDSADRVYGISRAEGLGVDDPLVFLSQPESIVLTQAFADRRGLGRGGRIVLDTPAGRRSFAIQGLLRPQGAARAYGGNLAIMDLYAAMEIFTEPGLINQVDVMVRRDVDLGRVADAIAAGLPAGLRVEPPLQRKQDLQEVMWSFQVVLWASGVMGLVAAFLIAFNRLTTVFETRAWQLGVMRAVGLRSSVLWRELVKESMLLGAAGVLLGIPLGIQLGRTLQPFVSTFTRIATKLTVPEGEVTIQWISLVVAMVVGFATPVAAAALPACRSARMEIAETIRSRRLELPSSLTGSVWLMRGLILLTIIAVVAVRRIIPPAAWGLVMTGLVVVATALVAEPCLKLFGGPLVGLRRLAGPTIRLAAGTFLHCRRRAALTVATVGVGLGTVLWIWTVGNSFERSVIETLSGAVQADLVVSSAHVSLGFIEAPVGESLLTELSLVPGIAGVVGSHVIDWPHRGASIAVQSMDSSYFTDGRFGRWPLLETTVPHVGPVITSDAAVLASSSFLLSFGAKLGDTITLATPTEPLSVRIVGVIMDFVNARGTILMDRQLFVRYWQDRQINRAFVRLKTGSDGGEIRAEIVRRLGTRYRLRILSAGEVVDYYASQVRRAFSALSVLAALVLVVVLIGVADTLAAGVLERTSELGTMRAIGLRRRYVRRFVLIEGLGLGLVGFALASVAGLTLGVFWVHTALPSLLGWVLDLHIPYRKMGLLALLSVGVCLMAGILPAHRAARIQPAEAIRYE